METQKQSASAQYLAALVVSLLGFVAGIMIGWSSPNVFLLMSDASPLPTGKITMEEASWIPSLKVLGFLMFSPMFGFIGNKFGRKWPMLFLSIPSVVSWLLIWFVQNMYYIHMARFLHGLVGAGVFSLCQFYFVEVSDDSIRGALGSTAIVSANIGVVIAMALGTYFDYKATPICAILLTVLFGVIFFFFPETPIFLVKHNKISKAGKSIRFYQNIRDCNEIQAKIEHLRHIIDDEKIKKTQKSTIRWSDIVKNPGKNAIVIGMFLSALYNFSGSYALLNYTATIFDEAGSFMSANESALIVGIIQFIGTTTMPFLVDRAGRKVLYIISTAGSILGFAVLGSYMMLKSWGYSTDGLTWIPIVSYSSIVLVQSLAISTLLYAIIAEIMPENMKEFGVTFCNTALGMMGFPVLKFMPLLTELFGFHGTMFLFGGFCIPSLLFIIFYMPETKGKSYEEIMKSLK